MVPASFDFWRPPDTPASRHVSSDHPSALMSGERGKRGPGPSLVDAATSVPEAPPSKFV